MKDCLQELVIKVGKNKSKKISVREVVSVRVGEGSFTFKLKNTEYVTLREFYEVYPDWYATTQQILLIFKVTKR